MELTKEILNIIVGVCILIGVVYSFLGYRIFKYTVGLGGFIIGTIGGWFGIYTITDEMMFASIMCVVCGAAGAILAGIFFFVAIFILGASMGGLCAAISLTFLGSSLNFVVLGLFGGITGVLAVIYRRIMIIISTSTVGSWAAVFGVAYFLSGSIDPQSYGWMFKPQMKGSGTIVLTWLVFASLCIFIQFLTAPKEEEDSIIDQDKKRMESTPVKAYKKPRVKKEIEAEKGKKQVSVENVKRIKRSKQVSATREQTPQKRIKPASQVKTSKRTKPVGQGKPVRRAESADQRKTVRRAKLADQEKPVKRAKPVGQEKPVKRPKPVGQEKPVKRTKPPKQVEPVKRIKPKKQKKKDDDDWMSKLSSFE